MQVLGIDTGAKYVGLAVVEQDTNSVLYAATLKLRDDIRDILERRRAVRRQRRNRLRYRPKRFEDRILRTECKYVDPQTGEICGKHTPKRSNVSHLLRQNILNYLNLESDVKEAIEKATTSPTNRQEVLNDVLKPLPIDRYIKKQLKDIAAEKGEGRTAFCRLHITEYLTQSRVPVEAFWLPPSVQAKQQSVLNTLRKLAPGYKIQKICVERANFDLQLLASDSLLEPEDYQTGPRFGYRNTFEALKQEYHNRCCFCGKQGGKAETVGEDGNSQKGVRLEIEHVVPKGRGGDNWENLVLACRACNQQKGNRTPEEAGMKFYVLKTRIAGMPVSISLRPKSLPESRIHRYMTQTDQGYRKLYQQLREIYGNVPIEETQGYKTSFFRNRVWKMEKKHHNDAVVIAADQSSPDKPPQFSVQPQEIEFKQKKNRQIFDTNPVRFHNGKAYQQIPVIRATQGLLTIKEIEKIVNSRKRELLERLREELGYAKTSNKSFPKEVWEKIPFRSVIVEKKDASEKNLRRLQSGWFKATESNQALVLYRKANGKTSWYVVKSRRAFGPTNPPADFQEELVRFKKGDRVRYEKGDDRLEGVLNKILSNGSIAVDGVSKSPRYCTKI